MRINDLLSDAVGCCQDVILINEGASAKLSLQIHQRSLKQCIEKMSRVGSWSLTIQGNSWG